MRRRQWEAVYCYTAVLKHWIEKCLKYRDHENYFVYFPFLLRMAHQKALADTNMGLRNAESNIYFRLLNKVSGKEDLVTFWKKLNIEPLMPYIPFQTGYKFFTYYRTTECNELNTRTVFTSQERIKLLQGMLNRVFKIDRLIEEKLVYDVSPMHDYYLMLGHKKYRMLRPVI